MIQRLLDVEILPRANRRHAGEFGFGESEEALENIRNTGGDKSADDHEMRRKRRDDGRRGEVGEGRSFFFGDKEFPYL